MIIRREALAAVLPAVEDEKTPGFRLSLTGIRIEPEARRIVATNGHVLLIATDKAPYEDADYPIVPGAPFHGDPKPLTIPAETVRRVLKAIPKRSTIPILQGIQVSANGSDETATIAATDLSVPAVATIRRDDLPDFPQYDRVLPKVDRPELSVVLATDVLEAIIKSAKAIHGTKTPAHIRFDFPTANPANGDATIRVSFKGSDLEVSGAAMPCRD